MPIETPRGEFDFVTGRHSVLLKAQIDNTLYGIKCYTSPQPLLRELCTTLADYNSELIIHPTPLPEELWVGERYVDIALYPWVEGHSLDREIRRAIHNHDRALLGRLLDSFCRLSIELLEGEWRHGDLKGENIIVGRDGRLLLVDCDALYSPLLPSRGEAGTPPYVHPSRKEAYDSHIDDYAIALIITSLAALTKEPSLATREPMVASPGESKTAIIRELFADSEPLVELLDALHKESYVIDNLKEILQCINPK